MCTLEVHTSDSSRPQPTDFTLEERMQVALSYIGRISGYTAQNRRKRGLQICSQTHSDPSKNEAYYPGTARTRHLQGGAPAI